MTKPSNILPPGPAYDEAAHLAYVQQLHAAYALNSEEKVDAFIGPLFRSITDGKAP